MEMGSLSDKERLNGSNGIEEGVGRGGADDKSIPLPS